MGFFDKLGKYIQEGNEARQKLKEGYKYYSDGELFHELGRILYNTYNLFNQNNSSTALRKHLNLPPEQRMKAAAIKEILKDRGYAEEELETKAIDSY